MKIAFLPLSFVLCALPAVASSQIVPMPTKADFTVGEQWDWRRVDQLTDLETLTYWRRSIQRDDGMAFLGSSKRIFTIESVYQSNTWRAWPLEVGKAWTHRRAWQSGTGEPGTTTFDVKVAAYEDVTVPAGTYKAFRIEYRGTWTMRDFAGRNWGGDVADTYWYAPEVKADVRQLHISHSRDGADSWKTELTRYGPAPP